MLEICRIWIAGGVVSVSLRRRATSSPLMSGRLTSSATGSGEAAATRASPSRPLAVSNRLYPARRSVWTFTNRPASSSSTTSIVDWGVMMTAPPPPPDAWSQLLRSPRAARRGSARTSTARAVARLRDVSESCPPGRRHLALSKAPTIAQQATSGGGRLITSDPNPTIGRHLVTTSGNFLLSRIWGTRTREDC